MLLLTILHHIVLAYLLHCIIWPLAHVCSYALDHAEPEPGVQAVQLKSKQSLI
jgi:hypothetical protein